MSDTTPAVGGEPAPSVGFDSGVPPAAWREEQMAALRSIEAKLKGGAIAPIETPEAIKEPKPDEASEPEKTDDEAVDKPETVSDDEKPKKRRRRRRRRSSADGDDLNLETALNLVRAEKYPNAVVESMTDEQLLDAGAEARRRHQELETLRRERDDLTKAPDDSTPVTNGAQVEEPTVDVTEMVARLKKEYGDEAAEAVTSVSKEYASKYMGAATDALRKENAELRKMVESIDRSMISDQARRVREEIGKRFPDVLDSEFYEDELLPKMADQLKTGTYDIRTQQGVEALHLDSLRLLEVAEGGEPGDELDEVARQAEDNGQVTPAQTSHESPRELPTGDKNWKYFQELTKGKSRHEAQRSAGLPLS